VFLPDHDDFGKDIVAPPDMVLADPESELSAPGTEAKDTVGDGQMAAASTNAPPMTTNSVSVNAVVLGQFKGPSRRVLLRHLATSSKWFLSEEDGKLLAYRRRVIGGRWRNTLGSYYSSSQVGLSNAHFQCRVVLAPDGPVLDRPWQRCATYAKANAGEVALRTLRNPYGQGLESYLVVRSSAGAVEIFEQSESANRPFTPLALQEVVQELNMVLNSPTVTATGFDTSLMPPESLGPKQPGIAVVKGMQGGIYLVYAYVNPGTEGHVYLKVYEATRNTPLSAERLKPRSVEYTGWSESPEQTFFYNTEVTVYEGDWGTFYPARFELWFVPGAGGPERKLIEKVFRIEGWQR
jgi:hypothetical protein